jgi:hypothetical protein
MTTIDGAYRTVIGVPRRGLSDDEKHARAVQAAQWMISGGEGPGYRLEALRDGSWAVVGLPGVTVSDPNHRRPWWRHGRRSPRSSRRRRMPSWWVGFEHVADQEDPEGWHCLQRCLDGKQIVGVVADAVARHAWDRPSPRRMTSW